MAATSSAEVGGNNYLDKFANYFLEYHRIKAIDVETVNDDNNVPDRADVVAGTERQAAQDTFGGSFNRVYGGLPAWGWLAVGVGGLAALKMAKVF